jgi:hypothetical protein
MNHAIKIGTLLTIASLWGDCSFAAGTVPRIPELPPFVPVTKLDDATAAKLAHSIPAFPKERTPAKAKNLGSITANSCKHLKTDPDASAADATNQLRLMAGQKGGNAVGDLVCGRSYMAPFANCWMLITCSGSALKL